MQERSRELHVTLGNEAADLDSICGAIARAKILQHELDGVVVVHVINIPRAELALRRDAEILFRHLDVNLEDLIFIDEIKPPFILHLVDHNSLALHQHHLQPLVQSIYDHHVDEEADFPACLEKEIQTVGSATTLLAAELLNRETVAADWAELMLAPILLDTSNLQSKQKTTAKDRQVAEKLLVLAQLPSQEEFYQTLLNARFDTEGFTEEMLLCKDLKRYQEGELIYTISAIPSGATFSGKGSIYLLREKEKAAISLVKFQRKLIVNCESKELMDQVVDHFKNRPELAAMTELETVEDAEATFILAPGVPRKELQPKLRFEFAYFHG